MQHLPEWPGRFQARVLHCLVETGDRPAVHLLVRAIAAVDPHDRGLVSVDARVGGGAAEIAERAPLAVQSMKQTLRAPLVQKVRAVLERELSEQARLWATEDSKTGIAANLAREKPVFTGR